MVNYCLDIDINETCAFCPKSFTCLRSFVMHLDENCKERKHLTNKKIRLNRKQRLTITRRDDWCKHSTGQLNQQLAKLKGTNERSVVKDTRSDNHGSIKGARMGTTLHGLVPVENNAGEVDEGSSAAGSLSSIGMGTERYESEVTKATSTRGMPEPPIAAPRDCGPSNGAKENEEVSASPMNIGDIRRVLSPDDPSQRVSSSSELFFEGRLIVNWTIIILTDTQWETYRENASMRMETKEAFRCSQADVSCYHIR